MTVQADTNPISMGPNDFQRTDRGITWGIKFRNIGIGMVVFVVVKQENGTWQQPVVPEAVIDSSFEESIVGKDTMGWIRNVLLPRLNAWLARAFPALSSNSGTVPTPTPAPVTLDEKFADADSKTRALLKITVNADGTLSASLVGG